MVKLQNVNKEINVLQEKSIPINQKASESWVNNDLCQDEAIIK